MSTTYAYDWGKLQVYIKREDHHAYFSWYILCHNLISVYDIVIYYKECIFHLYPLSWHTFPKTYGISEVISVFLCANEITDGWRLVRVWISYVLSGVLEA